MVKFCFVLVVLLFTQSGNVFSRSERAASLGESDRYFRNAYHTGTEYFWLRADGKYRRFNREHMGIFLADKGTWILKGDEFVLRSEERVRHITSYPLQIHLYHFKDKDKKLSDFLIFSKEAVAGFLAEHSDSRFSSNQIEKIMLSKTRNPPDINVLSGVDTVSREELEGLLEAIDALSMSQEKNVFRVKPVTYKAFTFLIWQDDLQVFGNNVDYVKDKIDKLPKNGGLDMVLVETSKAVFDQESQSTQPFIFYPEMNQCVPQPSGDEIK